jgi:hypothetical protein
MIRKRPASAIACAPRRLPSPPDDNKRIVARLIEIAQSLARPLGYWKASLRDAPRRCRRSSDDTAHRGELS